MAALVPDESSRVDLVTGDLDVYVDPGVENLRRDLEHVEVRKSLEFAEIRRRLRSPSFARVRQRVFRNISFSGAERWLVLEVPPDIDLPYRLRVPEFTETRVWEGDPDILPRKWTDAVRAQGVDPTDR